MIWTGPAGRWPTDEHNRLAAVLPDTDRQWLARMADVLEPGHVITGMATPPRAGVVSDPGWPGGIRLVHAPTGPGGTS